MAILSNTVNIFLNTLNKIVNKFFRIRRNYLLNIQNLFKSQNTFRSKNFAKSTISTLCDTYLGRYPYSIVFVELSILGIIKTDPTYTFNLRTIG